MILLPFPPSCNGLYPGKARRYKSKAYKAWITEAEFQLRQQSLPVFKGKVIIHYWFGRPDRRRRDLENYLKAVSDILVTFRIIEDDSDVEKLVAEWSEDVTGVMVEIEQCAATAV